MFDKLINKIINWLSKYLDKHETLSVDTYDYDSEIRKKKEQIELFDSIVGDNPLKQIDWIIDNGFNDFHELYNSLENNTLKRNEPIISQNPDDYDFVIRGGIGNKIISSWGLRSEKSIKCSCGCPIRSVGYTYAGIKRIIVENDVKCFGCGIINKVKG